MQSGLVNASQLLTPFLGSENEKIVQSIAQSDFAGELKKLMPPPSKCAGASAPVSPVKSGKVSGAENSVQTTSPGAHNPASAATPKNQVTGGHTESSMPPVASDKNCRPGQVKKQQSAVDPGTKIKQIESKARKEENLFVTNPAAAEAVLADLQCPAETMKAFKGLQNKEGRISIKDLKSLVDTQSKADSQANAEVPAEHVRALIESIMAGNEGANQETLTFGGNLESQIKAEGTYSSDEFRGLLEKVLQGTDESRTKLVGPGSQLESDDISNSTSGLRAGQTERLAATGIPSFMTAENESEIRDVLKTAAKTASDNSESDGRLSVENENAIKNVLKTATETVRDNSESGGQLNADKIVSAAEGNQGTASDEGAGAISGRDGSLPGPSAGLPSATQNVPVGNLDPILNYFDARIVSVAPQQFETKGAGAAGPYDGLAAQIQSLAPQLKSAEKQADGPHGASGSATLSQDMAEHPDTARTTSTDNHSSESSSDGNPNQSADPAQMTGTQENSAKLDLEQLRTQFQGVLQGVDINGPSAVKLSDPVESIEMKSDFSPAIPLMNSVSKNQVGASASTDGVKISTKIREYIQGETGKTTSTVVNADSIQTGGKPVEHSDSPESSSRFDNSTDNLTVDGDTSDGNYSPQSMQYNSSATITTDTIKAEEYHAASGEQDTILAKQVEKQLGSGDLAQGGAVFQNTASAGQVNGANLARSGNSEQNGFVYDPYRAAELVQNMREQSTAPSGQMVLEMEPDGLGKINIKVGVKKDEISVEAMTQGASAKETLMRHSPELRQDLQDQGLVLGKFMVDVNGEKSGGGNYPEGNKYGGKTASPPKAAKVRSVQDSETAVYTPKKVSDLSQISLFA